MNIIMHNMGCNGARLQVLNSDGMTPLVTLCNGTIARTEYLSSGDRIFLNLTSAGGMGSILNFTAHVTSFIMQGESLSYIIIVVLFCYQIQQHFKRFRARKKVLMHSNMHC